MHAIMECILPDNHALAAIPVVATIMEPKNRTVAIVDTAAPLKLSFSLPIILKLYCLIQ